MRTTISLNDELLRRAKREAADRGTTLSGVIEDALRCDLERGQPRQRVEPFVMVTFFGEGGSHPDVDINDNRALRDLLDEDGGWTSSM
jgi:hypothetical protein